MNPDELQRAWQTQHPSPGVNIDMDQVLSELRQSDKAFSTILRRRDLLESGVSFVMIPIWIIMGIALHLPWSWYLTIPSLAWIGGFMTRELLRRRRNRSEVTESLRTHLDNSLAEVEHQIRLLRGIFWWYLLPLVLSILAFLAHVAWLRGPAMGWIPSLIFFSITAGFVAVVFAIVYAMNQSAVRKELEPRRRELEDLRQNVGENPTNGNGP